jgi:hypothetical protein
MGGLHVDHDLDLDSTVLDNSHLVIRNGLDFPEGLITVGVNIPGKTSLQTFTVSVSSDVNILRLLQQKHFRIQKEEDFLQKIQEQLFFILSGNPYVKIETMVDFVTIPHERGRGESGLAEGLLQCPAGGPKLGIGGVPQIFIHLYKQPVFPVFFILYQQTILFKSKILYESIS